MKHRENGRRGFTLIELLVVIAIIALLVSILVPSLAKAKRLAKVTVCASNLHSFGLAVPEYEGDNNGKIPTSAYAVYPGAWWFHSNGSGQIALDIMAKYISGLYMDPDTSKWTVNGSWVCPTAVKVADAALIPGPGGWGCNWWPYAYFGSKNSWASVTLGTPTDITTNALSGSCVLMNDSMIYTPGSGFIYNHGDTGTAPMWTENLATNGHNFMPDLTDTMGGNTLFGDVHVEWIDRGAMKLNLISSGNPTASNRYLNYGWYFYY